MKFTTIIATVAALTGSASAAAIDMSGGDTCLPKYGRCYLLDGPTRSPAPCCDNLVCLGLHCIEPGTL
ncbi:hypothetical protein BBO_01703 [Beauveria brongniartii RCEF 3172]|uniref:Uncharacterized protein n=1 Tax=Beauveria brongniartii RCEF 3172 TaxID=1081107 RepID=A0A162JWH3_9HYPO|nr:hypothetical protein BBO_01703 [Beauveria brongniartii RCEF 3172]